MSEENSSLRLIEVSIEELAYGGDGVGRLPEGKIIFVPDSAPGEVVVVKIVKETRSYARGQISEIKNPSASRRQPICPLVEKCGGCQWQHVQYEAQVEAKEIIFREQWRAWPQMQIASLCRSSSEFGYRRRVRMHFNVQNKKLVLGFYRRNSRELLDVESCPLLQQQLNQALPLVRKKIEELKSRHGSIVLLCGQDGQVHFSLRSEDDLRNDELIQTWPPHQELKPLCGGECADQHRVTIWGAPHLTLRALGAQETLIGAASCFAQANREQETHLGNVLQTQVASVAAKSVLELHAGVGTWTQHIASQCEQIIAVESFSPSAKLLWENIHFYEPRVHVREGDAAAQVRRAIAAQEKYDLVVLDPPREGCPDVVKSLSALSPKTIIYVSCDPLTLKRDVDTLASFGYVPHFGQAFDMMPQTFHFESLVVLTKN